MTDAATAFLHDPPALHAWGGTQEFVLGGFNGPLLRQLYEFCRARLPAGARLLETGAGNTTILFLLLAPSQSVAVTTDAAAVERLRSYCAAHGIDHQPLEAIIGRSQWLLPSLVSQWREQQVWFDFALIDGCHTFPVAFADFLYCHAVVRQGGFVMIDDLNIHSCKELARYLLSDTRRFRPVLNMGKAIVLEKLTEECEVDFWEQNPYVASMTAFYEQTGNPYRLSLDLAVPTAATNAGGPARAAGAGDGI